MKPRADLKRKDCSPDIWHFLALLPQQRKHSPTTCQRQTAEAIIHILGYPIFVKASETKDYLVRKS
jgi:hypothetical protein